MGAEKSVNIFIRLIIGVSLAILILSVVYKIVIGEPKIIKGEVEGIVSEIEFQDSAAARAAAVEAAESATEEVKDVKNK